MVMEIMFLDVLLWMYMNVSLFLNTLIKKLIHFAIHNSILYSTILL